MQALIQRGTIQFRGGIIDDAELCGCFVSAYDGVMWEVVDLIGTWLFHLHGFNDTLLYLLLDCAVVLFQYLRILAKSPQQTPHSLDTEIIVVS